MINLVYTNIIYVSWKGIFVLYPSQTVKRESLNYKHSLKIKIGQYRLSVSCTWNKAIQVLIDLQSTLLPRNSLITRQSRSRKTLPQHSGYVLWKQLTINIYCIYLGKYLIVNFRGFFVSNSAFHFRYREEKVLWIKLILVQITWIWGP